MLISKNICFVPPIDARTGQTLDPVPFGFGFPEEIFPGAYTEEFFLGECLPHEHWNHYPLLPVSSYGFCDSSDQWKNTEVGKFVLESPRKFVVAFDEILDSKECEDLLRRDKDGPYLGIHRTPQKMFSFHVFEYIG